MVDVQGTKSSGIADAVAKKRYRVKICDTVKVNDPVKIAFLNMAKKWPNLKYRQE